MIAHRKRITVVLVFLKIKEKKIAMANVFVAWPEIKPYKLPL
jgi:hypothetical protein